MADIEDRVIPGPVGDIPLRIHRPTTDRAAPCCVYFHGGGMVLGTNHSFEPLARDLADASGPRWSPWNTIWHRSFRHPRSSTMPTPRATWVSQHAEELGVDPARLAVIGDSAGGALAAAVALASRDRGGPPICRQVLLYPGLDRDMAAASIVTMPDAPMLTLDDIDYMHELADAGAGRATRSLPAPPRTPPTCRDCRRRSSSPPNATRSATGANATRSGCAMRTSRPPLTRYPGSYHGFLMRSDAVARGRLAVAEIGAPAAGEVRPPASVLSGSASRSPERGGRGRPQRSKNRARMCQTDEDDRS